MRPRVIKIGERPVAQRSNVSCNGVSATGFVLAGGCIHVSDACNIESDKHSESIECVYVHTRGRYCISTLLVRFHPPFVDAHCHWNIFNNNNNNIALCARSPFFVRCEFDGIARSPIAACAAFVCARRTPRRTFMQN
jgi:hypothetical protein